MKKIIMLGILLTMFFCLSPVYGQTWYIPNQSTVGWDEVTNMIDGNGNPIPIPAGDSIFYDVYTVKHNESKDNKIFNLRTDQTEATISMVNEGKYFVGIETVRIPEGETDELRSARAAWSDNPDDCKDGNTFGFKYYYLPYTSGGMVVR